ncbi:MAG: N-acetyl-gamma-glutamyl-phosphate reductase [Bacteroidales bacterium]|nr:N-acetyl-gamma-glutamyl-phosphate reductase [Bacteroidales bacterium]
MIKAGIIGAAGYTAGELIRILINHPEVEIVFAQSASHAGEALWKAHADLFGDCSLTFSESAPVSDADVVFLCSGHGKSAQITASFPPGYSGCIIDLSNDFRLAADAGDYIYALPEAFRSRIAGAKHLANPGCFATAIQLALLPAAKAGLLSEVHITGITGSTGAGQKPSETTHFSWRSDNLSIYKPFTHQHLAEIRETLLSFSPSWSGNINFVPIRGDFTRGILVSAYFDCGLTEEEAVQLYEEYYRDEPFTFVCKENPDLKMVTGTNKALVYPRKYGSKLHITCVIDNLLKGASGQAVQNMNILFGIPEKTGLALKANRW